MALRDIVRDPVSGQSYEVSWDGRRGSASLLGTDERYTRQRSNATAHYTSGAIGELGIRPDQIRCDVKVDWPWR